MSKRVLLSALNRDQCRARCTASNDGAGDGHPGHFRPPPLHGARGSVVHAAV